MAAKPDPGAPGPEPGLGVAAGDQVDPDPGLCQLCYLEVEDLNHVFFSFSRMEFFMIYCFLLSPIECLCCYVA